MSTGFEDDNLHNFASTFGNLGAMGATLTDFASLDGRAQGKGIFAGVPNSDIFSGNTSRAGAELMAMYNKAVSRLPLDPADQANASMAAIREFMGPEGFVAPPGTYAHVQTASPYKEVSIEDPALKKAIENAVNRELHAYFQHHRKNYGACMDKPYEHHHVLRMTPDGSDFMLDECCHENAPPAFNGYEYILPVPNLAKLLNTFRPMPTQGILSDLAGSVVSGARGVRTSVERSADSILGISSRPTGARSSMNDWKRFEATHPTIAEFLKNKFKGWSFETKDGKHVMKKGGEEVHVKVKPNGTFSIKTEKSKHKMRVSNGRVVRIAGKR